MLSILTYHSLDTSDSVISTSPENFARQMDCLANIGFRGIALREAVAHREATGAWPGKCAVLTFDDGYANFYDSAWPVLLRHGFTATLFIVSDHMGKQNDWAPAPYGLGKCNILSWQQAAEVSAAGIEIGAHTRTHPHLRRLSAIEAQQEIVVSRVEIENQVGRAVKSFAYPFGETNPESTECVKKEFHAACTTVLQRANGGSLHSLPRVDMYYLRTQRKLERLLKGQLDQYLRIRRWGRSIRRVVISES